VSRFGLWPHTQHASIVDATGHSVRLHCVNWGLNFVPDGLDRQRAATIIGEIASPGYDGPPDHSDTAGLSDLC
jgi:hypothetical protein